MKDNLGVVLRTDVNITGTDAMPWQTRVGFDHIERMHKQVGWFSNVTYKFFMQSSQDQSLNQVLEREKRPLGQNYKWKVVVDSSFLLWCSGSHAL